VRLPWYHSPLHLPGDEICHLSGLSELARGPWTLGSIRAFVAKHIALPDIHTGTRDNLPSLSCTIDPRALSEVQAVLNVFEAVGIEPFFVPRLIDRSSCDMLDGKRLQVFVDVDDIASEEHQSLLLVCGLLLTIFSLDSWRLRRLDGSHRSLSGMMVMQPQEYGHLSRMEEHLESRLCLAGARASR
jgi:hypothetical protein